MNQITTELAHYGTKGMKWGVRKDRGHEGESAKTSKIAKLDKKYAKSFDGVGGWVKVNNAVADKVNPKVEVLNAKPEYSRGVRDGSPQQKKYLKEYEGIVEKSLNEVMNDFGTNASGTKRLKLEVYGFGYETTWKSSMVDIKHAAGDFPMVQIVPHFNDKGLIDDYEMTPLDEQGNPLKHSFEDLGDFLEHYGVKGMKWGVRRDKTPTDVQVKAAPGKLVKASGGKYQGPSEDAIRAARARQQAKKSSVDSLSNQELQALVTRMNLEQQYARLKDDPARMSLGKKVAKSALEGGGAELAVLGAVKGAAKLGLSADPRVAVGLKVAGIVSKRLTEKAIVKSGDSRNLQKFDAKNDTFNKLKPDYAEKMAAKAAKAAKSK